jgi:hypothetical protein
MQIRPFRISVGDDAIADLKRRLLGTRWPSAISDVGWGMGMDAAFLRSISDHWLNEFDWSAVESALNRHPQFIATTDRGDIHFVHLRGRGLEPLPIILTHG